MAITLLDKIKKGIVNWMLQEAPFTGYPLSDFERITYELRPGDVLLTEGRSRVADVIKVITQSSWSHAALYIGRIHDIENPLLRDRVREFYDGTPDEQMIIESVLGRGTVISALDHYRDMHIRICRPRGISRQDAQQVIGFAIGRLGREYDIRHNLDLFRFLFPWSILPRRWRSSLFEHRIGGPTKEICSSMLAEAFNSVNFPILPIIRDAKDKKGVVFYRRNPKLFTPRDFDYSPYFEIIKYPIFEIADSTIYRNFPWTEEIAEEDAKAPRINKVIKNRERASQTESTEKVDKPVPDTTTDNKPETD